jgi:hypothetical protein
LVESLADVTATPRTIYVGGNPGFASLVQDDLDAALAKGWTIADFVDINIVDLGIADFAPYMSTTHNNELYISGGLDGGTAPGYLSKSSDDGQTFTEVNSAVSTRIDLLASDGGTNLVGSMTGPPRIIRSTNNGTNFTTIGAQGGISIAQKLFYWEGNFYYQGLNGSFAPIIVRSSDGTSWSTFNVPAGYENSAALSTLGLVFASSDYNSIGYFEDATETLGTIQYPLAFQANSNAFLERPDGRLMTAPLVFGIGSGQEVFIYISNSNWRNEGVTWSVLSSIGSPSSPTADNYGCNRIYYEGDNYIYGINEFESGVGSINSNLYSPDGGETLYNLNRNYQINFVAFVSDGIIINGVDGGSNIVAEKILYDAIIS